MRTCKVQALEGGHDSISKLPFALAPEYPNMHTFINIASSNLRGSVALCGLWDAATRKCSYLLN